MKTTYKDYHEYEIEAINIRDATLKAIDFWWIWCRGCNENFNSKDLKITGGTNEKL